MDNFYCNFEPHDFRIIYTINNICNYNCDGIYIQKVFLYNIRRVIPANISLHYTIYRLFRIFILYLSQKSKQSVVNMSSFLMNTPQLAAGCAAASLTIWRFVGYMLITVAERVVLFDLVDISLRALREAT